MPEIWLSYGTGYSILDIKSENLGTILETDLKPLSDEKLDEQLADVSGTLVILQNTPLVHQVISRMYSICERRSAPFPNILADKSMIPSLKEGLPEGCRVDSFQSTDGPDDNMVFVSEIMSDGLFGYDSVCTKLLRRFGDDMMLKAYNKRTSDTPSPGHNTTPYGIAQEFVDGFEIYSIDILGGRGGIEGLHVGHPASNDVRHLAEQHVQQGTHVFPTVVASVGDTILGNTLAGALSSLWSTWMALKSNGKAVLLAECKMGLGSDALRLYVEGRLSPKELRHPSRYISGMEELLFLESVSEKTDITLVSALPQMYESPLKVSLGRMSQHVINDIIQNNPRRKITIMPDASRIFLGEYAGGDRGTDDG